MTPRKKFFEPKNKAEDIPIQDESPKTAAESSDEPQESEAEAPTPEDRTVALENEVKDWKDKYLRSMAEFDNFRKRSNQEKADWIRYATEKLALSICDVMDNFERAILQIGDEHKNDSYLKGIFLIEQQLRTVLEKEGVKKIEALNQEFDPKFHEALAHIPSELEENMISAIIQNGYTMHDKVIRPVRVAVSNGTKPQDLK